MPTGMPGSQATPDTETFGTAWGMVMSMLGMAPEGSLIVLTTSHMGITIGVIAAMLAVHWFMRDRSLHDVVARTPWWLVATVWAGMLFMVLAAQGDGAAFIYFQF